MRLDVFSHLVVFLLGNPCSSLFPMFVLRLGGLYFVIGLARAIYVFHVLSLCEVYATNTVLNFFSLWYLSTSRSSGNGLQFL